MVQEDNIYMDGGNELGLRTEAQCQQECLDNDKCEAADFSKNLGTCYIHTTIGVRKASNNFKFWAKDCGGKPQCR